jgi:DNA-binding MarR family transcriptional regulator
MYLHAMGLPVGAAAGSMAAMSPRGPLPTASRDPERLSACVCNTLRMVTRAVTQLYDDALRPSGLRVTQFSILATLAQLGEANLRQLEDRLAVDQTTLTRSINLLERDGVIERAPHPDRRVKALRPTAKGRRLLHVARPLWSLAQDTVLRELGTKTWADARRRLARLRDVAVENRSRRSTKPSGASRRGRRKPA